MQGAYDLHMHAAPSPFHRVLDDYGLLEEAGRAGMAGIMLKSHYESTIARAILANIHCASCTKAYGGLVLNWPVGGLNPYAVENAMKRGCRIVWMPTRDAKNSLCSGNMPGDFFDRSGISILINCNCCCLCRSKILSSVILSIGQFINYIDRKSVV